MKLTQPVTDALRRVVRVSPFALMPLVLCAAGSRTIRSSRLESMELSIACDSKQAQEQMPDNAVIGMVVGLSLPEADYASVSKNWVLLDGHDVSAKDYPDLAALMLANDPKHKNDKMIHLPDYTGLSFSIPIQAATESLTAQQVHLAQFAKAHPSPATIGEDRPLRWYLRAKK